MIIRIIHATDRTVTEGVATAPLVANQDRQRLARRAMRVPGLETLIIGWRAADDSSAVTEARSAIVVMAWLDVASMLAGTRSNESTFLRELLGLDVDVDRGDSFEVMSRTFGALPTPSAILRVVTMRARPSGDAVLFEMLRAIQERLTRLGLIGSHVARRVVADGVEAVVVGVWRDESAIAAATGGQPDRPAFVDDIGPLVEEATVVSYDAIEIAPRLPSAAGPPILVLDGSARVVDLTTAAAAVLGRSQDDVIGLDVSRLASVGEAEDEHSERRGWSGLLDGDGAGDATGGSTLLLPFGGQVLVQWRLRRDVPVPGRHILFVRREGEGVIRADDIDSALAEAFPVD
ncbi:MAG TPA: hypothetical protein VF119_06525 [Candidatus Limnocylindrales bacterium]